MPLGKDSLIKLGDAHESLQAFIKKVSIGIDRGELVNFDVKDITVICSYRGPKEQNEAFAKGTSKKRFPDSKHNVKPSLAVDIAPFPIDWSKAGENRFKALRLYALGVAQGMGTPIRIISWDLPHYELGL